MMNKNPFQKKKKPVSACDKAAKGDRKSFKQEKKQHKEHPSAVKVLPSVPAEWLYVTDREVSVADIAAALDPQTFPDVEIWKAAGVAEITLGEKASMDMEQTEVNLGDEYSNAFLAEHQARSLYLVTIQQEAYDKACLAMNQITAVCGGFFCGDTEDFTPLVK